MFAGDVVQSLEASDVLSIEDAAKILRVSPVTVWRLVKSGRLPAVRVGKKAVRIRKPDLALVVGPVAIADGQNASHHDDADRSQTERTREQAATRILRRREEIGTIEDSTTDLIHAGIEAS